MVIERWRPRRGLTIWDPFREMEDVERRLGGNLGESWLPSLWSRVPEVRAWVPDLDVFEKDGKFVIKAELPGMEEKDVDISIEGDTLTIKGEKETEKEVKEEGYYRCERAYGSFFRSVPLPSSVDKDKVEANFNNGVLEITLSKTAEAKPKKVKVSASRKS